MSYNGTMTYFKELFNETMRDATWIIIGIIALLGFVAIMEFWLRWREIDRRY